ncbi:hypothetical protein ACJJIL_12615 [Microbulbifer sp. EKSA005]|uniref:hypothetical protein n=1 Tax=Microbulbifer sp. EKSA005 TaxID=3243364 RepID=UPI0040434FE2
MRVCLFFMTLFFSFFSNADPLERYDPQSVAKAVTLASRLSSSEWNYTWRGRNYKFVLEEDGSISKLKSWKDVRWVVVGANEIVLEGYTDRMHLFFDKNIKNFKTFDWDGTKATGTLAH